MPINKDLHLTAEVLTLLHAGFYGQILFEGALARMNSSLLPEDYLKTAHKTFDKLEGWNKDLYDSLPIFSVNWTQAETFDAISAMNFLKDLKRDLLWIIPQFEQALAEPELWNARDSVKLLAAGILRSAAVRSAYVETLMNTFYKIGAPELAHSVSFEIEGAKEYLRTANIIVETFTSGAVYDVDLCEKLRREASLVPSDCLSLVHDANILMNVFKKEFTFEMADISREEAEPWAKNQIPAVAAGYWRAYGFAPEDYKTWSALGITGAPLAANWRRCRFAPEEAIEWIREGIPPVMAVTWRAAGFDAKRAASLIRRGVSDPSRAPKVDPEDEE